jgi:hypothetical protein
MIFFKIGEKINNKILLIFWLKLSFREILRKIDSLSTKNELRKWRFMYALAVLMLLIF